MSRVTVNTDKLFEINKLKKQKEIEKLLLESDYIELPSFLERKGTEVYNQWMSYRTKLRLAYHDQTLSIPEKPEE